MLEQSQNSDRVEDPDWNGGQPAAPGAAMLKQNLAGFQLCIR